MKMPAFNSCIEESSKEEATRRIIKYAEEADDADNEPICVK